MHADTRYARSLAALLARPLPAAHLVGVLVALLGLDQLLLWRFLDFAPWWLYAAAIGWVVGVSLMATRLSARITAPAPTLGRFAVCALVALLLFLLGGEGRLFYANVDWQVRDAILHDMTIAPWPFAYTARGTAEILRAPIGMYLLPALAGKAWGPVAADLLLLARNSLFLAIILTLGSLALTDARSRWRTLAVFLCFSGMDALGGVLSHWSTGAPMADHLEFWTQIQFSSHITQAFWVPQHALSGWLCALLFLLWKDRGLPLGILVAVLPLLALWSPFGPIGALPFAAYAAARTLIARNLARSDVALPALCALLAFPGLLYLASAGDSVGLRFYPLPLDRWLGFQLIETIPYIVAVWMIGVGGRFGRATLAILGASLLLLPFAQIGESVDLAMRGSIPALAILSVLVAQALGAPAPQGLRRGAQAVLLVVLAIGGLTGLREVRRGLAYLPAPRPLCSFSGAWDQSFSAFGKSTYLAPVTALPALMRPAAPTLLPAADPAQCWHRAWMTPR